MTDTNSENDIKSNSKVSSNNRIGAEAIKMKSVEEEESGHTADVVIPPDGGWGWVVMVASFLCNTIVDGIVFSAGMFQEPIRNEFQVSKGYVALVSSLLSGCYLIAGPFVSALATGIAMCGSGVGTFIFAPLSTYLIETYGWRNSLLVQAALILLCSIFGSAYRPILPIKVPTKDMRQSSSWTTKEHDLM